MAAVGAGAACSGAATGHRRHARARAALGGSGGGGRPSKESTPLMAAVGAGAAGAGVATKGAGGATRHGAAAMGGARTCLIVTPCAVSAVVLCVVSWPSSRRGGDPQITAESATASSALLVVARPGVSLGRVAVAVIASTGLSMGGRATCATGMAVACEGERAGEGGEATRARMHRRRERDSMACTLNGTYARWHVRSMARTIDGVTTHPMPCMHAYGGGGSGRGSSRTRAAASAVAAGVGMGAEPQRHTHAPKRTPLCRRDACCWSALYMHARGVASHCRSRSG